MRSPLRMMTDFKMLTKLVLAFGTVVMVAAAGSWLFLGSLSHLGEISRDLGERDVHRVAAMSETKVLTSQGHLWMYQSVAERDAALGAQAEKRFQDGYTLLSTLLEGGEWNGRVFLPEGDPGVRQSLETAARDYAELLPLVSRHIRSASSGNAAELADGFEELYASLMQDLETGTVALTGEMDSRVAAAEATVARARTIALGMLVTILIVVGSALLLWRTTTLVPLARVMDAVRRILEDDLSVRLTLESQDELGELSRALNGMAVGLDASRKAAGEATKHAEEAQAAAEEAAAVAEQEKQYLSESVDALLQAMGRLSSGDLKVRMNQSGADAIGTLFAGFDETAQNLWDLVGRIRKAADSAAAASEQIHQSSSGLATASEETSNNAQSATAATGQVNSVMEMIASAAEQMTSSIREISQSLQRALEVNHMAADRAGQAVDLMDELNASSSEIGDVVQVINTIADQTNLLALNATIEAARAGEAGKGFAVVANEVKQLAGQTARATEEIGHKIQEAQDRAGRAVGVMGDISNIIGEIDQLSTTIASAVEEQTAVTQEIARNVVEAVDGTQEATRGAAAVSEVASRALVQAQEAKVAAEQLTGVSGDLKQLVGSFSL